MIRVVDAHAAPLTFRLREGYRIAGHRFTSASMVLLRVTTSDGRTGYGCAAPFEEVTGESPAAALAALSDVLLPLARAADAADEAALLDRAAAAAPGAPAARAALDMALHDLWARRAGEPLYRRLARRASASSPASPSASRTTWRRRSSAAGDGSRRASAS